MSNKTTGSQPGNAAPDKTVKTPDKTGKKVDAGVIFLRLAGKQPKKVEPKKQVSKDQRKGSQGQKTITFSTKDVELSKPSSPEKPAADDIKNVQVSESRSSEDTQDLFAEEIDEQTLATCRELFNSLVQTKTGLITAASLYEELQSLDSEITFKEVEDVLKKVDKDGNGEIDFDEFLYHMTHFGSDLLGGTIDDEARKKKMNKRKSLFCSAITSFSFKKTLAELDKTFRLHLPHVIGHYIAGARLLGLTTRQLERQMIRMKKSIGKSDSPYAQPLFNLRSTDKEKTKKKKKKTATEKVMSIDDEYDKADEQAVENLSKEIQDAMLIFKKKKSVMATDAKLIIALQNKIGAVNARLTRRKSKDNTAGTSSHKQLPGTERDHTKHGKKLQPVKEVRKRILGFATPKIHYYDVPLPSLKINRQSVEPTFSDIEQIREKMKQATDIYFHNLRQAEMADAWGHWDHMYAKVLPEKLIGTFKTVFGTYSPRYEEQVFVIHPWKPGPFRLLKFAPKPPKFSLPFLPKSNPFIRTQRSDSLTARRSESSSPVCGKTSDSRNSPRSLGRQDIL